jgi:hypothetical protein
MSIRVLMFLCSEVVRAEMQYALTNIWRDGVAVGFTYNDFIEQCDL